MNQISETRLKEILDQMKKQSQLLVVGDIGLDKYTYGEVRRISPEAPVPVLEVQKEWIKLGMAANISDNLMALEVKSQLCGVVGEDDKATLFENILEDKKLSTWGLVRDPNRPTTFKERVTTSTQQICRIDYEDRKALSSDVSEKLFSRIEEFIPKSSGIILEDYAKGVFGREMCQNIIKLAKKNKRLIGIDPGLNISPDTYSGADLLKPNLKEARSMAERLGKQYVEVSDLLKFLLEELKLQKLVVTLGPEGMAYLEIGGTPQIIPTLAKEVFDVSGAGDTAMALLMSSLVSGASLHEACQIANLGSAVVVAKKGTATVTSDEIMNLFNKNFS